MFNTRIVVYVLQLSARHRNNHSIALRSSLYYFLVIQSYLIQYNYLHYKCVLINIKNILWSVTADYPPREVERERPRPARPAPPSPAPPHRPPPPQTQPATTTIQNNVDTDSIDLLNLNLSGAAPVQEQRTEKKLGNQDSFDFFGLMEKPATDDNFGDFLSGQSKDNIQVSQSV